MFQTFWKINEIRENKIIDMYINAVFKYPIAYSEKR